MNLSRPIVLSFSLFFCFGVSPFSLAQTVDQPAQSQPVADKHAKVKKTPKQILAAMSNPKLAERLDLSDEQKAKASALLSQLTTAVDKAVEADQAKIVAEGQEKLAALLTDQQREKWTKMQATLCKPSDKNKKPTAEPKKEPRLRFNFRFQSWADVLDWFAKQADLALVLDSPVPGTFNYTDTNEYTPIEAIDLLNSVLLTKGYTLIRRERMLMVVNLQDGLPEGMVPRVSIGDLKKRGRFEMVSVLLPLSNRNVEEVNKEIAPFLGPYGKCVPLAKTGQLMVTDTAGILQAVEAMIQSMPVAAAKPQQPQSEKEPKPPTLVIYPVESADPQVAVEVLKSLLPEAKIVLDAKAAQINVFAAPAHQAVVKSVLEQMQANNPPERQPRLEVYRLNKSDLVGPGGKEDRRGQLLNTLQVLAPKARITVDSKTGKLVVWGTPEQHATITCTLEKLRPGSSPNDTVQIEVHRLTSVDPSDAMALLSNLLPEAQFAVNTNSRSLIAIALPNDQAAIRTTLAELQGGTSTGTGQRRLQSHRLSKPASPTLLTGLRQLAPSAQISLDPSGLLLTVVAPDADLKAIEAAVKQIEEPVANRQLEVYRLDDLTAASTMELLRTLTPRAELSFDIQTQNLVVLGTTSDQKTIQATLDQLRAEQQGAGAAQLLFYPLDQSPPPSLIAGLQQLTPKARITLEAGGKRLMVVANAADHAKVAAALKRLDENVPLEASRFEVYAIRGTDVTKLLATISPLVPAAKLSIDPKTNRLLAWATDADHRLLRTAVGQLEDGKLSEDPRKLEIYKLHKVNPTTALGLMQTIVPDATLSIDASTRSLIALAVPEDQATIRRTIERLKTTQTGPSSPVLRFYELMQRPTPSLVSGLTQLFPESQITLDGKRLMVIAGQNTQKAIESTIARIEETMPIDEPKKLVAYSATPAEKARFNAILPMVTAELPGITVVADAEPGVLSIWAKPTQHVLLTDIISQLKLDVPNDRKHRFVGYPIASADPAVVLATVQSLLPNARLSLDPRTRRLLAWCSPADHEKIKQALEQMDSGTAEDAQDQLMVYPIPDTNPTIALQVLAQSLPGVQFHSDPTAGTIIAKARKSDQKIIAKILTAMQASQDLGHKQVLEVYATGDSHPETVMASLQSLVPKARLVADPSRGRISAWASSKDQEKIRQAVEKLAKAEDVKTAPTVASYSLGRLEPAPTMRMLRAIVPQAQVAIGADSRKIIVWTRPADQQRIAQTFERMQTDGTDGDEPKVVVYQLESTPPSTAMQMIAQAVPGAIVTPGADGGQLVVWALLSDHEKIKTVVGQLAEGNPVATLKTYTLESVTLAVAIPIIQRTVPHAILNGGSDPQQLIARARPADHEKIAAVIAQLSVKEDPETAPSMAVYALESGSAASLLPILQNAAPRARITVGPEPHKLIVHARPSDHAIIKAAIDEIGKSESGETASKAVVYEVDVVSPYPLLSSLTQMVPSARFTVGSDPGQIIAWARSADHEKIKTIIDEIGKKKPAKMVVYKLDSTTASSLMQTLRQAAPRARFSVGANPQTLIAWAADDDHAVIKAAIDEIAKSESGAEASVPVVYKVGAVPANQVINGLRTIVPGALFTIGAERNQLVAWARPADQEKIKKIVAEMSKKQAAKMVVYTLESTTATAAIRVLGEAFPNTRFAVGTDARQLIAWASEEDQTRLAEAVKQLSQDQLGKNAPTAHIYTLKTGSFADALVSLRSAVPEAKLIIGADPRQLTAWARPVDHEKIAQIVEQMTKADSAETASRMAVYELKSSDAVDAIRILQVAFKEVRFSSASDGKRLMAWARPDEQMLIKAAIEQIEAAGEPENDLEMAVYPIKYEDAASLLQVIDPLLAKNAKFVTDPKRDGLIVWADKERQAAIKKAIESFLAALPITREPITRVYYFRTADPRTAMTVLTALVPTAKMAVNAENRSLAVSARPDDHEKIKAAVEQIDQEGDAEQAPKLEAHRITSADPAKLFAMLQAFFRRQPEIQLSLDDENETVMALATPRDHKKIKTLIAEVEKGNSSEVAPKVEVYSLKNVDSDALKEVLDKLLEKDLAKVQLSVDSRSDQLVAIARPKHQEIIRETIDRMRTEEQTLEIFQLNVVDPATATLGIDRLFDSTGGYDPTAPVVDVDEDSQQLFVSATKEQHEKIRELLTKMGETNLKKVTSEQQRTMRVVPFRGDVRTTLKEIRRVWPQLRDNPIEIVDANAVKKDVVKNEEKSDGAKTKPVEKPTDEKKPGEKKAEEKTPDKSALRGSGAGAAFRLVSMNAGEASDSDEAKPQAADVDEQKAPVLLILGPNAITVKSDDPRALEQMESLLRSLAPQNAYGRNIGVYPLRNTDAVRIAARLQQVMLEMRPRWQRTQNRTMIVADDRLNAIVVKGNRADRATIESMVRILDAPESPESLEAKQPTLIPVKNTEASRVERVVREVFSAQLSTTARQGRGGGSSRWTPQVSVDSMSNSLIVVADPALFKQIEDLVATLDTAAGDESVRGLKIISLKKTNASRVEKALGAAIQRSMGHRGGGR